MYTNWILGADHHSCFDDCGDVDHYVVHDDDVDDDVDDGVSDDDDDDVGDDFDDDVDDDDDDDNLAIAAMAASRSPWSGSSFSPPSTLYIIMITPNITLHIISLNITNMIVIVVKIIIIKIILKNHLRHQPIILKLYTVQSKTRPS